ncbi:MAG: metallophosphoesterase family protein [Planctomycetes bacterium]|nr:metallophosphoesterase family protein [Planctomycetota bacterium]
MRVKIIALAFICTLLLFAGKSNAQANDRNTRFFVKLPYLQDLRTTSTKILFQTRGECAAKIEYGTSADSLGKRVNSEANATFHNLLIEGLEADTRYYYRVTAGDEVSEVRSFQTLYVGNDPFEFLVYGDNRAESWVREGYFHQSHQRVCMSMLANAPDARFVLNMGDLVNSGVEEWRWDAEFFGPGEELFSRMCMFPTIGNHERNSDLYFQYFEVPGEDEHYYAFTYGDTRIITLDVHFTDFSVGSAQYEWYERELEASCGTYSWVFVTMHYPPLSSGGHGNNQPVLDSLIPLAEKYGVDVFWGGHDHNYERSYMNDIVYVTSGGGGAFCLPIAINANQNPWSELYYGNLHYCQVKVDGLKLLCDVKDVSGKLIDKWTIDKSEDRTVILPLSGETLLREEEPATESSREDF